MNKNEFPKAAFPRSLDPGGEGIEVSVFCQTFNHAPLISNTLDRIIEQETDFRFEIIVHDDASTDGTFQIVQEYAENFPSLIRPVLQQVNQYSKGRKPIWYAASCAEGRYVALCEGDDTWTDPRKLQSQIDALAAQSEMKICFHPAKLYEGERDTGRLYGFYGDTGLRITPQKLFGGAVVPTASIVLCTDVLRALPRWFYTDAPVGDFYIRTIASVPGGALYIPKVMCAYRAHNPGSWSSMISADPRKFLVNNERHIGVCEALDEYLNYQYTSDIAQFRNRLLIGRMAVLLKTGDMSGLVSDSWRLIRKPMSLFKTLFHLGKVIVQRPYQVWQAVSRNFSYSWTDKPGPPRNS